MYKLLLCWRYLRTRYIALASIISVTLGVATMIVVNSVMEGFSSEMQNRIHGILSDVIFTSAASTACPTPTWHMEQIRQVAGDQIEAMSPTVVVPAMLYYEYGGQSIPQQVQLIGIDEEDPEQRERFRQVFAAPGQPQGDEFRAAQGRLRRPRSSERARRARAEADAAGRLDAPARNGPHQAVPAAIAEAESSANARRADAARPIPSPADQTEENRVRPGQAAAYGRRAGHRHGRLPHAHRRGQVPHRARRRREDGLSHGAASRPRSSATTSPIVDFYESKMSEYDATLVFVPIRQLQELRGMIDPTTGVGLVNAIQIKLKPGADGEKVRDKLQAAFREGFYRIETWRDRQGPLLAAVQMEKRILNLLLFLIIAVAGFGILAIFYMIVVEKTRDIGILKSLGAPAGA